jgi:histidinol dehydrogenase
MQVIEYPTKEQWKSILKRPAQNNAMVEQSVKEILFDVKTNGDKAVKKYTSALDGIQLDSLLVDQQTIQEALVNVTPGLKTAIKQAAENITKFHKLQVPREIEIEVQPGLSCKQRSVPLEKVGIYIPGGTAPLFSSVLMMAIPAKIAGCKEVSLFTPPGKSGSIDPSILCAASVSGVNKIYQVGGAQAIAAMAYGTESIPCVDKILGPGNQYVTQAKQQVNASGIAIDMPAGPSEVMILADSTASPEYVAADLLAQAEHGPDSQVFLLTNDSMLPGKVNEQIDAYLKRLSRADIAKEALSNSKIIVLNSEEELMEMSNLYAPEHLIIATKDPEELADKVINAGSVFLGDNTPESLGDYASGTNHVLPTNGTAKAYSGVNLETFMKKITFQKATKEGLKSIGETVMSMAKAEQLEAHKLAVEIRMNSND